MKWSLKAGRNVFIVPVIPGRVAFALLAVRAFAEWDADFAEDGGAVDPRDIVALTLPAVIAGEYVAALQDLPHPSVLLLKSRQQEGEEFREIVSVAPHDGFTEAARQALARGCSPRLIDVAVDPSQLVKDCSSAFPPSFDDGAVLAGGVTPFLSHMAPIFMRAPVRSEPADSLREVAIASVIQELAPRCRRLFVFCSAPIVRTVAKCLRTPQLGSTGFSVPRAVER